MSVQSKPYEVLDAPDLKSKVKRISSAEAEQMFAKAESAIADLGKGYVDWVSGDLEKIDGFFANAKIEGADRSECLSQVFGVSHDIKGQAATFGYPLITEVADSLCSFIEHSDADAEVTLEVVDTHVNAMKLMVRERMEGDGGAAGKALTDALHAAVSKVTG